LPSNITYVITNDMEIEMIEKITSLRLKEREYHITKIFMSDSNAQEAFWSRYFIIAARILPDNQIATYKKAVKYEECNSISQAQH
jgi:hypothetical protein